MQSNNFPILSQRNKERNFEKIGGILLLDGDRMEEFLQSIQSHGIIPNLLVTPFLVDVKNEVVYELLWYTASSEIVEEGPGLGSYNKVNSLPREVIDNLKPVIRLGEDDMNKFICYFSEYFKKMKKMKFADDSTAQDFFDRGGKIFYEVI